MHSTRHSSKSYDFRWCLLNATKDLYFTFEISKWHWLQSIIWPNFDCVARCEIKIYYSTFITIWVCLRCDPYSLFFFYQKNWKRNYFWIHQSINEWIASHTDNTNTMVVGNWNPFGDRSSSFLMENSWHSTVASLSVHYFCDFDEEEMVFSQIWIVFGLFF